MLGNASRILVIGCSGAGKSTVARRLSALTGLSVIHLDQHYWRRGWEATPQPEWNDSVIRLAARPSWIMDGNYSGSLAIRLVSADLVIYLDLPRWRCLLNICNRYIRNHGRPRADGPYECPDRLDPDFFRWVWRFRRDTRPRVEALLARARNTRLIRLRSTREVRSWLAACEN